MICNSSYLADKKNLEESSDVDLLSELGHREKIRIIERLSDGEAKQKELVAELGLKSGTVSRWLTELTHARVISQDREGSHDPYWLVKPERTNEFLDLVALLASELADAHAERADRQAKVDKRRLKERQARTSLRQPRVSTAAKPPGSSDSQPG